MGSGTAVRHKVLMTLVHFPQGIQQHVPGGEHSVSQQKSVQEINAQKSQISETVKQPVHAGMADLKRRTALCISSFWLCALHEAQCTE